MLDNLKRRYRPGSNDLPASFNRIHHDISGQILGNPLPYQKKASHQGEGDQDTGRDPDQIREKISHIIFCLSRKPADKSHTGRIPAPRRDKHHKGDHHHLGEIGKSGLSGIMLKICIRHKTDNCIKRKGFLHCSHTVGIQDGQALDPQDQITRQYHNPVRGQKRSRISLPAHSFPGIHTPDPVDQPIDAVKKRIGKGMFPGCDVVQIRSHRNDNNQKKKNCQYKLQHNCLLLNIFLLKFLRVNQRIQQIPTQKQ